MPIKVARCFATLRGFPPTERCKRYIYILISDGGFFGDYIVLGHYMHTFQLVNVGTSIKAVNSALRKLFLIFVGWSVVSVVQKWMLLMRVE